MIKYFFKDIELGTLSFDNKKNEFVYNSNIENEKKAKKYGSMFFYSLYDSIDKRQKNIFDEFEIFAMSLSREDIVKSAGIKKEDNLFQKLEKLSKLTLNDDEFHLKYAEV